MIIKNGNIPTEGFDYYIEDSLGGVHTDGAGYAPDGTFCGECTRESCLVCPAWNNMGYCEDKLKGLIHCESCHEKCDKTSI